MYDAFRVHQPDRGLLSGELNELGKINVICGRNNSGKSTVLQALANSSSRHLGVYFNEEFTTKFYADTARHMPWMRLTDPRRADKEYQVFLKNNVEGKTLYLSDWSQLEKGFSSIGDLARHIRLNTVNFKPISDVFSKHFHENIEAILLPTKRKLETRINAGQTAVNSLAGEGVVRKLLDLKNKQEDTPESLQYKTLREAFQFISDGCVLDVVSADDGITHNLVFKSGRGEWRAAEVSGSGLQELLIILFFAITSKSQLLLVEEPENHLHPDMQRRLLQFLRDSTDKQYFFASHSNIFVSSVSVDRVFMTRYTGQIEISDESSKASMLRDIGYSVSENLVSDLIVLVEGPKDMPLIEELLAWYKIAPRLAVRVWPLGGDIMDKLDLSVFGEQYKIFALIDRDPKNDAVRKKFIKKCAELKIPVHRLLRYSIENYLTIDAIKLTLQRLPIAVETINPDTKVQDQLGLDVKDHALRILRNMKFEDVDRTDLGEAMRKVRALLEPETIAVAPARLVVDVK